MKALNHGAFGAEFTSMLALLWSMASGRAYHWRPALDLRSSFLLSTLFADGGH
jgi:hypothetical protein